MNRVYLSLAAVVRDQAHYIKEWLTFHHLLGVERFVLVLHRCVDETERRIRELPFFERKIRLHQIVTDEQKIQLGAYRWLLDRYGRFTQWMLFIDTDEFFFGTRDDHLPTLLARYERHDAVAAHWLNFGSSGCVAHPDGLSIETMTWRASDAMEKHRAVKSVVRPSRLVDLVSPHLFAMKHGTVREHGDPCSVARHWYVDKAPSWDILRVNHYHTRSMEDWVDRHKRGSCNCTKNDRFYSVEEFHRRDYRDVRDTTIHRFLPPLKRELGL